MVVPATGINSRFLSGARTGARQARNRNTVGFL